MTANPNDSTPEHEASRETDGGQLNMLIGQVLQLRANDAGYRSAVAKGLADSTEHHAYPFVLPFVTERSKQTAYLRAAGLAAATGAQQVKEGEPRRLGASFRAVSRERNGGKDVPGDKSDFIAKKLVTIVDLDLEEAVGRLHDLLKLAKAHGVAVNFFEVARLIERWGNGISSESKKVRQSLIADYYGGWNPSPASSTEAKEAP